MHVDVALLRLRLGLRGYDSNQPRVPAGQPGGGQWTGVTAPAGTSSPSDRTRVAQYSFGRLIGQTPGAMGSRTCFYEFDFGIVAAPGPMERDCPPTVPSAAVTHGRLFQVSPMTTSQSRHASLPANFTISAKAKIVIEDVRREWNDRFADPAVAVWIAWGLFKPHSGPSFENVVVSFYGRSQLSNIADAIQNVSGLDVVLFTIPEYLHHFDGKVLDHDPKQGFFLRDP